MFRESRSEVIQYTLEHICIPIDPTDSHIGSRLSQDIHICIDFDPTDSLLSSILTQDIHNCIDFDPTDSQMGSCLSHGIHICTGHSSLVVCSFVDKLAM